MLLNKKSNKNTKEKKAKKEYNDKNIVGTILMATIAAVVIFIVMVNIEKSALSSYEKGTAYITATTIPRGEVIDSNTVNKYFKQVELDKKMIPDKAILNIGELVGKAPYFDMDKDMVIMYSMFRDVSEYETNMKNPREVGLSINEFSDMSNGVIRSGDIIDIYITSEKDYTSTLTYENVYVLSAFNASGGVIANSDKTSICEKINVLIDSPDISKFYKDIEKGSVRIVKVRDSIVSKNNETSSTFQDTIKNVNNNVNNVLRDIENTMQ